MVVKVECHKNNFNEKLKEVVKWRISDLDKIKLQTYFRDYELGKITGRRGSNPEGNLLRNLYFLKVALENLKSDSKKDVENFMEKLFKDNIRTLNLKTNKYNSKPYAIKSKIAILKNLSKYLQWKLPTPRATAIKNLLNVNISNKKPEIETLTDAEVNKLFKEANTKARKYMIAVLNSSGMRAEEFHNVRLSDIKIPSGNEKFVKVTIRNQFSKTEGRTISLYEKNVLKAVKDFLNKRIAEGIKPEEPVFPITYNTSRKWLREHGNRVLRRNVYYHLFRHTSATRLSSKMNRQQLCIYFGWKFSSPMPDIYIKRSGVNMEDVENHFSNTRMEELEEGMKNYERENERLNKEIKDIQVFVDSLGDGFIIPESQIKGDKEAIRKKIAKLLN